MNVRACCVGIWSVALVLVATLPNLLRAEDPTPKQFEFFEKQVRPVLVERCHECHSADNAESDFRADSRAALLHGGKRGPAIAPGDPEHSLMILAVNHADQLHMPPKSKIPQKEIEALTAWVKMGAPWPQEKSAEGTPANAAASAEQSLLDPKFTKKQTEFWAFRPPVDHPLPVVKRTDWVTSSIDAFVLARLEAAGFEPAPPADRRALIRRVTFDLTGLPPTPEEIRDFLADESPVAFARVVDRLLASPHYGERWGRHWLDVARYGDSNGLDENLAYANAFRYRDYVIAAFNADKPYDRFLVEQLAGDLLPENDPTPLFERLTATGYLVIAAKMLAEDDPMKMQMDIIDEQIETTGKAVLGMTFGCARCHDHKFDPVSMADYYALAGIFKSTKTMENFSVVARWQERPLATPEQVEQLNAGRKEIASVDAEIKKVGEAGGNSANLEELKAKKKSLEESLPKIPEVMAVSLEKPQNVRIHFRGNHVTQGPEAPRRFPKIMADESAPSIGNDSTGRLELTRWLTSSRHPLTARVFVNRVWRAHFGAGLVRTADNFGLLGEPPTHPELLDHLAVTFMRSGWSEKQLHRMILLSSTYQMSTRYNEGAAAVDPENRLLWRMDRRRLSAEEIRDAILACGGSLDRTMTGTLLTTPNRNYVTSTANVNPVVYQTARRSVYLPVVRSALYEVFQAFDFPDPTTSNGERGSTTVAPQALFMMNSELTATETRHWADRLLGNGELQTDAARIAAIFERAYGRLPTDDETSGAIAFLKTYQAALPSDIGNEQEKRTRTWQGLCRAVLSANEFLYVE